MAPIRLAFVAMVAGWSSLVGNYLVQDWTGGRHRDEGVRAAIFGSASTVLFVVTVAIAWSLALRAVVADRREPAQDDAVRRQRDRRRRLGRTASRWAVAAGCVGLLLARPVASAIEDLRTPDDLWPSDPLEQFDVAADDAAADAAELETVLAETADQIGSDFWTSRGLSRVQCRLPDGSVGTYYDLTMRRHDGFTRDPVPVIDSAAGYGESLGYAVDEMSYARTAIFSREMHTSAGGMVYIKISSGSTELSGHSGCSATDSGVP